MADEVVRRLSLTFSENGADATTGKVNKLSDATTALATVTDTNAKRSLSAEAAWLKLNSTLDSTVAAQAKIERGTKTLNDALAQGVITQEKYNESLGLLKEKYSDVDAANDNVKEGFRSTGIEAASVANHVKQAAEAAYVLSPAFRALVNPAIAAGLSATGSALAFLGPTAGVVATSIASRLAPALGLVLRVAGPIMLVVDAIKLIGFAWSSASDQIEKYNGLATQQKGTGVDADFFQRMAKGSEDAKIGIDAVTASLKKFKEVSDEKLGGSALQTKIDAHIDAGNLDTNSGVEKYSNANGAEAKYRAMLDLLKQMNAEGKNLAALDIASTFASPEQLEEFRKFPGYFQDILDKADAISTTKLVSSQDIADAVQLKSRYDEAVRILSERWIPFQETITAGGMALHRTWVNIVEAIAAAFTGINNLATAIANLKPPSWLSTLYSAAFRVLAPAPLQAIGAVVGYAGTKSTPEPAEYQPFGKYTGDKVPDKSNELKKETEAQKDLNDAVDRAINQTQKHVLQQEADAKAVGLGAGALARYRVEASETAAVLANGGKETEDQRAKFAALKVAATDAADALEKARVASDISRGRQTAFLSQEDVQIANQLRGIYGDNIPKALASSEAAAMRFNNVLKTINDTVRSSVSAFALDLAHGLTQGKSLMDSLDAAAKKLAQTILDAGINSLVKSGLDAVMGSLGSTATQATGATTSATIFEASATAMVATWTAGATAAAAILAGGGTAAAVGIDVGTSVGGAELVTSGVATGVALETAGAVTGTLINGPLILLVAAIAAAATLIGFGGNDQEDERRQRDQAEQQRVNQQNEAAYQRRIDLAQQTRMVGFDTSTVAGQLQAFDSDAWDQRRKEAEQGNGAIVSLEELLAAKRISIIDKANQAISKSLNDFLNSIKTGASSILSPEDQLKYAQNRFNSDVTAGQGGDEAALNRVTQDAQNLLDIAKAFYASTTGYTTIYQGVTDAITALASHDNIHAGALAANTYAVPATADTGMKGFAAGGIVGNGTYNVDSVMARYAGGGNIGLAGGEAITRASSVNASTMGTLSFINRTGKVPGNDNAEVVRVLTQGFNGQTTVLSEKLDTIADRVKRLEDTTRQGSTQRRVPGAQKLAA